MTGIRTEEKHLAMHLSLMGDDVYRRTDGRETKSKCMKYARSKQPPDIILTEGRNENVANVRLGRPPEVSQRVLDFLGKMKA